MNSIENTFYIEDSLCRHSSHESPRTNSNLHVVAEYIVRGYIVIQNTFYIDTFQIACHCRIHSSLHVIAEYILDCMLCHCRIHSRLHVSVEYIQSKNTRNAGMICLQKKCFVISIQKVFCNKVQHIQCKNARTAGMICQQRKCFVISIQRAFCNKVQYIHILSI